MHKQAQLGIPLGAGALTALIAYLLQDEEQPVIDRLIRALLIGGGVGLGTAVLTGRPASATTAVPASPETPDSAADGWAFPAGTATGVAAAIPSGWAYRRYLRYNPGVTAQELHSAIKNAIRALPEAVVQSYPSLQQIESMPLDKFESSAAIREALNRLSARGLTPKNVEAILLSLRGAGGRVGPAMAALTSRMSEDVHRQLVKELRKASTKPTWRGRAEMGAAIGLPIALGALSDYLF